MNTGQDHVERLAAAGAVHQILEVHPDREVLGAGGGDHEGPHRRDGCCVSDDPAGHSRFPSVSAAGVVLVGTLIFGYAMVSRRAAGWPVSMPMVFVGAGAVLSATGALSLDSELGQVRLIAEVALAVILFSDAVRIELRAVRRNALFPARLLLIGLPLTIVLGTFGNWLLFPSLAFAELALLAAILAPTDAALGAAVVEDERVPLRERVTLNVESGLNDGLVVPVVTILTVIALEGATTGSEVMTTIVEEIGFGLLVGVIVGVVAVSLLYSDRRCQNRSGERLLPPSRGRAPLRCWGARLLLADRRR